MRLLAWVQTMLTSSSASTSTDEQRMNKHILVVGGTSGIGAGIAQAFKAQALSNHVVVTGATAAEVDQARLTDALHNVECQVLDVRDNDAVVALLNKLDKLDVLVNCAGIIRRGDELNPETFAAVIDVNLNGTMRVCAAARALLKQSGGCIINTASMLSFFGGGLVPAYSASKGGIAQLTKSLAIAYATDGIRVNAIAPGWITTPLTEALAADPNRSGPILARTPMGRWGTPADVAGPTLFLASSQASFVTGAILPIDGGYLAV